MNAVDQANVTEQAKNTALANAKGGAPSRPKRQKIKPIRAQRTVKTKIQKGVGRTVPVCVR